MTMCGLVSPHAQVIETSTDDDHDDSSLVVKRYHKSALYHSIVAWSEINPHLLLFTFLPVLIFESGYNCDWHIFRNLLSNIVLLAVPGVVFCTVLTATILKYIFHSGWPWSCCLMTGAMLSATDPVAVVALMKELGVSEKLGTAMEGESLLNDGTSIVIFNVFLQQFLYEETDGASGEMRTAGEIAQYFLRLSLGGIALGLAIGVFTIVILSRIHNDASSEITLTVLAAFSSFLLAEGTSIEVSGILSCLVY